MYFAAQENTKFKPDGHLNNIELQRSCSELSQSTFLCTAARNTFLFHYSIQTT